MSALALPRGDWLLIAGAAVLLTVAYPPFHLFFPSFVCLIPVIWLIQRGASDPRPLRRHLVQGYWYGFFSSGLVLYWMVFALWRLTRLSLLGYLATIVVLAAYASVMFALTGWIQRRSRVSPIIVFPVLWTSVEWLVGHQGDIHFPWLGLGTSLTGFPTAIQVAEVIGARGVTLLLAAANTALAFAWLERRNARRVTVLLGTVAAGLSAALGYGLVREATVDMRPLGNVTVLQPNVQYDKKRDRTLHDSIVRSTIELSAIAAERTSPQLLVWPESALPDYLFRHEEWERLIAAHVAQSGVPIVTGGLDVVWLEREDEYDYYNSAFLFDATRDGGRRPVYHKRYLVPLVERVPFVNPRWFDLRWFGGFSRGEVGQLYEVEFGQFGIMICYESAFEDLSRDYRRRGADFLVNITNDDWYGQTTAPFQHAAHLVLRAIENRTSIVRAANSGISEFVDPLGRESKRTRLGEQTFAADMVLASDVLTIYTRYGDWVGLLVLCFAATLIGYSWWQKR